MLQEKFPNLALAGVNIAGGRRRGILGQGRDHQSRRRLKVAASTGHSQLILRAALSALTCDL